MTRLPGSFQRYWNAGLIRGNKMREDKYNNYTFTFLGATKAKGLTVSLAP